ncbi:MAG: carbamoyltransferase C-terminal domain-containing protein, partial [Planctomycetota bacterium]
EGEVTSTLMAEGHTDRSIKKLKEILKPDSLGLYYSTMTEYLGFRSMNGEYKVMGMAPYGDPSKVDLKDMLKRTDQGFRCDDSRVWVSKKNRYQGKHYSKRMVEELGPPREGDGLQEPFIHVAAATQKMLEDTALHLIERFLKGPLERNGGRLAYAGGVALNVRLNRKIIEHPLVNELFVQPASSDAGIALGAATFAAEKRGQRVKPMGTAALGPSYTNAQVQEVLERFKIPYERLEDAPAKAAELLAQGEIVAWFQGRMEFGPRALGQRSILGNPGVKGVSDEINARIKFREAWRPFCPSVLKEYGPQLFDNAHDSPYMTFTFGVRPEWKDRIHEVVHVDGTARPQLVRAEHSPKFHALLTAFHARTGLPTVINTSLNRRSEPMVCSPEDALAMLYGSGLEFLVIEDFLVTKRK